jgi:hypothetical protein
MCQTKTRGMKYSSNVSHKDKGYDILLEVLRKIQGLWYTPQNDYTNIWVMVYISTFKTKIVLYAPRREFRDKYKSGDIRHEGF